jgi:phosphate-selective porin
VFRHDGDNARLREPLFLLPGEEATSQRSFAARVTAEPLRQASGPRELRRLYLGLAFTTSDVPEGLNSLRARSLFGTRFAEQVYVLGQRRRIGTEVAWMPGPFSVKSEYARANEERRAQGLLDEDISDFVSSAWYVSGTWAVTGERKADNVEPKEAIFQGGFGAIELAARYERMSFRSALHAGAPFVSPRADPLPQTQESVWTYGVNWYLNKWGKIVVNGIRERFAIPEGTSVPVPATNWAAVARLQFVM